MEIEQSASINEKCDEEIAKENEERKEKKKVRNREYQRAWRQRKKDLKKKVSKEEKEEKKRKRHRENQRAYYQRTKGLKKNYKNVEELFQKKLDDFQIITYNHTMMADKSDKPRDLTDLPPPSRSNVLTKAQAAAASTSATPSAEPPRIAASKSKAQKQREYRQRIAASRTPAQTIAARKSDTERQRKKRLRKAANSVFVSGSVESTTVSSSRSRARSNDVQTGAQREVRHQKRQTSAAEPAQISVQPPSDQIEVQQAQSTWNAKWAPSIMRFKTTFLGNDFGYACSVCGRLWFKNDIEPITAAQLEVISEWSIEENRRLCKEEYEMVCNTCKRSLNEKSMPPLAKVYGFSYPDQPPGLPPLDPLRERSISPHLPFMQETTDPLDGSSSRTADDQNLCMPIEIKQEEYLEEESDHNEITHTSRYTLQQPDEQTLQEPYLLNSITVKEEELIEEISDRLEGSTSQTSNEQNLFIPIKIKQEHYLREESDHNEITHTSRYTLQQPDEQTSQEPCLLNSITVKEEELIEEFDQDKNTQTSEYSVQRHNEQNPHEACMFQPIITVKKKNVLEINVLPKLNKRDDSISPTSSSSSIDLDLETPKEIEMGRKLDIYKTIIKEKNKTIRNLKKVISVLKRQKNVDNSLLDNLLKDI